MSAFAKVNMQEFMKTHPQEVVNGTIRVCIGGGAGFIGSHLAKRLKEEVLYIVFILEWTFYLYNFIL